MTLCVNGDDEDGHPNVTVNDPGETETRQLAGPTAPEPSMTETPISETAVVVLLFGGYVGLWRLKQARDIHKTGVDPEVLARAATPVQKYFAKLVKVITAFVVVLIGLHSLAPASWPPLVRVGALERWPFDLLGAGVGLAGLALCALAQTTMGSSWRVGIDEGRRTDLVTRGIYRWIRNPTYVGLHAVSAGMWLIWPTTLVASYAAFFFLTMDIQVRCEEEHLAAAHGAEYWRYVEKTWRYVPGLY